MKTFLIIGTVAVPLVILVAAIGLYFFRIKKNSCRGNKPMISETLYFSLVLLLLIFVLKFTVGVCSAPMENEPVLNWGEQLVESFFRSLRAFGIEEEYPRFITQIKGLISDKRAFLEGFAVFYATVLEIVAPIAGGAIILEILSGVWPKAKLYLSFFRLGKRKYYYFNELNSPSLALAKSIASGAAGKKTPKPVLIFADTYVDREDEREYELLLAAKRLGAICVRDDLAHIRKPFSWRKHREYYLMDENEFGNLQSLARLVDDRNINFIKGSFIYLFVQSDAYVQMEKNIRTKFDTLFLAENEKPRIIPVRGYRNLVQNLLLEVPLYEPLVSKEKKNELNVTILGNGLIGTEAFLNAYWFGQMLVPQQDGGDLSPCRLTINVVSKDDEDTFWSKIDYVNPEIQKTVEKIKSYNSPEPLLVYNRESKKTAPPYCKVRYVKADLKVGGFWDAETERIREELRADYFIVALGSDADNISIAEKIRSHIGKKHIEAYKAPSDAKEKQTGKPRVPLNRTVVAYAVFDSELAQALNKEKRFKSVTVDKTPDFDIYMYAFGSLEDVYSCKNVYLSKSDIWRTISGISFGNGSDAHIRDNVARIGTDSQNYDKSNYDYWANLAKALHVKYKVFSLGWIQNSVFSFGDKKESGQENQKACALYLKLCAICAKDRLDQLSAEEESWYQDLERKKEYLAWLEHRRWNAFTRVMGYCHVDVERLLSGVGEQKDQRLKLHSCLAETEFPSISRRCYALPELSDAEKEELDCLDLVSKARGTEYKEYDYYGHEVGEDYVKFLLSDSKKGGVK